MDARPTGYVDDLPRFERFVRLAQILVAGFGFALVASWALLGHAADLPLALVQFGLAAWLLVAERAARHHGLGRGALLASLGILGEIATLALIVPYHPVLMVAPLLAVLVAVPFIPLWAMLGLAAIAWFETVAIAARASLLPSAPADSLINDPGFEIATVAVAMGLGMLLALHSTQRLREMLIRSRQSEAELRAAGDLLRGHHNLLETVFEGTTDHVYLKDAAGRYLLINEAVERWLGKARLDILGHTDRDLFDTDAGAEVIGIDAKILATGDSVTYEHAMTVAGNDRTYLTTKGVFRNKRGGVAGLFGISRDITERKHSEEQLRQAQKMEAVGRLAGGVAHDFNNVLTAITGYSELTMDALPAGDPIRLEVREIQLGADRAAALTRQLLAFSRRQVLQPEVVDPTAVIAGIEPMLRRLIPATIDLRVAGDPGLGRVRVDRRQLEQIVVNLAENARDAMPAGGRLTVETSNVDLDEQSIGSHPGVVPGPYVLLAVTDTGVGMSEEMQGHLFEPFFTTKSAATGAGLGLATVYGSVSQSGGHVWVTSQLGLGSSFKILLPRVDAPLPVVPEVVSGSAPVGGAGTILVVEDEPVLRALMQSVLTRAGYDVILAPDGEEGLRHAHTSLDRIDLVLTDVVMPVMGGPALAEAVHGLRPDLPVLFMSGFPDNAVGRDGLLDPSWAFIGKPFTPAELLQRIRDLVEAVPA